MFLFTAKVLRQLRMLIFFQGISQREGNVLLLVERLSFERHTTERSSSV